MLNILLLCIGLFFSTNILAAGSSAVCRIGETCCYYNIGTQKVISIEGLEKRKKYKCSFVNIYPRQEIPVDMETLSGFPKLKISVERGRLPVRSAIDATQVEEENHHIRWIVALKPLQYGGDAMIQCYEDN